MTWTSQQPRQEGWKPSGKIRALPDKFYVFSSLWRIEVQRRVWIIMLRKMEQSCCRGIRQDFRKTMWEFSGGRFSGVRQTWKGNIFPPGEFHWMLATTTCTNSSPYYSRKWFLQVRSVPHLKVSSCILWVSQTWIVCQSHYLSLLKWAIPLTSNTWPWLNTMLQGSIVFYNEGE